MVILQYLFDTFSLRKNDLISSQDIRFNMIIDNSVVAYYFWATL